MVVHTHTRGDEWKGTQLHFRLTERRPKTCELDFERVGISPEAVAKGWDHFLASRAAYAEHGSCSSFGP